MKAWNPPSSGPNRALVGLQKIRDRARDSARNDWTGEAAVRRWTTNLVGIGIVPRVARNTPKAQKAHITEAWNDWIVEADADGVLDFYGQQTLVARTWLDAGEGFARLRYRRPDFGLSVPLQVQLLEPDMVPMLDADSWPGLATGHKIRSGIELSRSGQRVAYWCFREHPGDGGAASHSNLVRVPASQMIHVFEPLRPGQLRGVPLLAPTLPRLRTVGDYEDAVLERQKLANLYTVFIKKPAGSAYDDDLSAVDGMPVQTDAAGDQMVSLAPGAVAELLPGEEAQFANPPEAGTTYSDYMRTNHMGTAAGVSLPYELLSGDIKEISDRTLRVLINEFRRLAEQRQWQILIPQFCRKVRAAWADAAVLGGVLSVMDAEVARRAEWAPHGWAYIHPVQDAMAKVTEIEAGLRSRSSVIAERGDDPEVVDEERKADQDREDELGIRRPDEAAPGGDDNPDEDGISQGEYPPTPTLHERILSMLERERQDAVERD